MLNFRIEGGRVVEVTSEFPKDYTGWINRRDMKTFADAERIAQQATELTGDAHVACEHPDTLPRFDVVRAPKVGDKVSYAFNGDYYPDGEVVKVSDSLKRVQTSTGRIYNRRRLTASWVNAGTWTLVQGHISKQNPSF